MIIIAVLAYLGRSTPLAQQLLMEGATNIEQQTSLSLWKDHGSYVLTYVTFWTQLLPHMR